MNLKQHKKELFSKKKDSKAIPIELLVNILKTIKTCSDGKTYIPRKYKLKKFGEYAKNLLTTSTIIYSFVGEAFQKREKSLLAFINMTGESVLIEHIFNSVMDLTLKGHYEIAMGFMKKNEVHKYPECFQLYENLAEKMLNKRDGVNYASLASLRDLLLELMKHMKSQNGVEQGEVTAQKIERCLYACHFEALYLALGISYEKVRQQQPSMNAAAFVSLSNRLNTLKLRIKVGSLRYIWPVLPDKAFFEAGNACKFSGTEYESMAVIFFRYLRDILDAIDENDPNFVDNGLFEGTDVPTSYDLPPNKYLTNGEEEEVKQWLSDVSVEHDGGKLRLDDNRECYEASAKGGNHANVLPVCVISAYPVVGSGRNLGNGLFATRGDWATFIQLALHFACEEISDVHVFLTKWAEP